jgi:RNA polymerase sigma factor (sigma-70 family)
MHSDRHPRDDIVLGTLGTAMTMTGKPDTELLQDYVATRNGQAFAELVRRHANLVYATARRVTGNATDAEDVAQACFMELARRGGRVRISVAGWLHRIATRSAITSVRRASARRRYEAQSPDIPESDAQSEWSELAPLVDSAIDHLPEELREVLVLHFFQGVSQTDLAVRLGVNQSTISRRIEHAIERLRSHLQGMGVSVVSAGLGGAMMEFSTAQAPPSAVAVATKIGLSGIGPRPGSLIGVGVGRLAAAVIVLGVISAGVIFVCLNRKSVDAWTPVQRKAATMQSASRFPVVRRDGRVWIEGLEEVNYGGSYLNREDSQVACLVAALRCAGQDVTYSDVMGLSGCAFKLTLGRNIPIHLVHSEFGMEWGPTMRDVFGMNYDAKPSGVNDQYEPDWRTQIVQKMRPAFEQGIPAFGFDSEWYLIAGYAENGSSFQWVPYPSGGKYREGPKPGGEPWFYCVMTRTGEPMDRKQAVLRSLRTAVGFANASTTEAAGQPMYWGFAAYEVWMDALQNRPQETSANANAFIYTQLLSSRQAAAEYLARYADLFDAATAARLREAAGRYRQIADRLRAGAERIGLSSDGNYTSENRAKEIELLRASLADERAAIDVIAQLLDTAAGRESRAQ